ncbi:ABC transporter substrate-binding protein [Clostridium cellulovorans]|uniref:Extracellular solute-binding protein family 1 n=1 Tax=Clostridium cellulovorans (strain ATCC 35296 / DSM 3052 / OCM 3 / 743B) TaxID=573061 RepID=D9SR33_CLOC7|nr:ABC transporter substrate-binding protein [Clostridium cellulovorans]ADL50321.1 extracellular solute-binding protein family 1 [Clostridium cellulovorans 743B]
MYKKLMTLIVIFVFVFSFSGCGNEKVNSTKQQETVTIKFSWWGTDTRHEATMSAVKKFQEKYPNIKVKMEFGEWTGFQKKMAVYIAGNTEPDVMQINYDWLQLYSKDGAGFYDLNKVSDIFNLQNFNEKILSYGSKNNIVNGVPLASNVKGLYYNKTTFDKFGVPIPKTWDDLFKAAEKFGEGYYPLELDSRGGWNLAATYVQQKTGKDFIKVDGTIGFSERDIKDLLTFYKSLLDKKVIPNLQGKKISNFDEGKYAGTYQWISNSEKYAKKLKDKNQELIAGDLPVIDDAVNSGWYVKPSSLFAISKNTEHPKEAAMLLEYLVNDTEGIVAMGTDRGLSVSNAAKEYLNTLDKTVQFDATEKLNAIKPVLMNPYFENTLIQNICEASIEEITYDKSTIDECAKNTYAKLVTTLSVVAK